MSPFWIPLSFNGPCESISSIYIPSSKFIFELRYGITSLSYPDIPRYGSSNLPVSTNFFNIGFTMFIGIAKPIPSASSIFNVVIPIISPFLFISGPPLFPWFIVASV